VADPRIAAEVRRVEVADREPLGLGQSEEPPDEIEQRVRLFGLDAVPDQLEEADLVRIFPCECGAADRRRSAAPSAVRSC